MIWTKILLVSLIIFSTLGCNHKPKMQWEESLYSQILTELSDSIHISSLTIESISGKVGERAKSIGFKDMISYELQTQSSFLHQLITMNAINRFDTITTNKGVRITVQDLIALPGNYAFMNDSERLNAIERIINERQLENDLSAGQGDLQFFGDFFPSYAYEGKNKFPTWLTQNIVKLADWDVLKLFHNTFFWKVMIKEGQENLLLFHADTKTLITLASNTTTDCQRSVDDPLACEPINAVIRAFFFCLPDHKDSNNESFVHAHQIQIQEFLRYCLIKDTEKQKYKILSSITYVPNNSFIAKRLLIPFDQDVHITTVGQVVHDKTPTKRIYGRDFIEVSFYKKGNIDEANRSICFYYNTNDSVIQHLGQMDTYFAFENNQYPGYVLKAAIPWNYIDIIPNEGFSFLMNVAVSDSDADPAKTESRIEWLKSKSQLKPLVLKNSWHVNIDNPVSNDNPTLILNKNKTDTYWSEIEGRPIAQLTQGEIQSDCDNSAYFKLLWDEKYLYLLVDVFDQVKQHPGFITTDYAQIIDEKSNELIWQAVGRKMDNFPEYTDTVTLNLKAGSYLLKYISNHSFAIDDMVPSSSGYGVTLKNVIP